MTRAACLRRWIPPGIVDLIRAVRRPQEDRFIARYLDAGRVPWSVGYGEYRNRFIRDTLDNQELMLVFSRGEELPAMFGHGLDERCIEYPWVFSQLTRRPGLVLDAGSTLNHEFLLSRPELEGVRFHIVTLAPESTCFWWLGHSYLYEDLRSLPVRDSVYDVVVCVSTLEHIGFDNSAYTKRPHSPGSSSGQLDAMAEFARVLRPGGSLLLTVPFGASTDLGSFRPFDDDHLDRAVHAFGPTADDRRRVYRYTDRGWQLSNPVASADATYVDWICRTPQDRDPRFPQQPDNAAAARAVALVRLVKP